MTLPHRIPADSAEPATSVPLRRPDTVMRLERLGSFHQTRLSFLRVLLRRLVRDKWQVERVQWQIDGRGEGFAVYEARGNGRVYSLVAFAHDLDPAKRTDRVIAEEWDATFVLHDGPVSMADIERLSRNVPKQEAGRCSGAEMVMARANKSVRLFDYVVRMLALGNQPELAEIDAVGYLMRTTAVYGSGKFGMADRAAIAGRSEFAAPFSAEMLAVWLIRAFTVDLAEHTARVLAPDTAVRMDRDLCRRLGVGNSTGLGMAPFMVNHPVLFHRWISARETALSRVRSLPSAPAEELVAFARLLSRARRQIAGWNVADALQTTRIAGLRRDLETLSGALTSLKLDGAARPWDRLYRFAEDHLGVEAQELIVSLLLERQGALIDDLADAMAAQEEVEFVIDGATTLEMLAADIAAHYGFALAIDFTKPQAQARFWYVSEEKLEPRLGERATETGSECEQPLSIARDVAALHSTISDLPAHMSVAAFLLQRPEFRHVVRRIQIVHRHPYAEIRDNLIGASMRPLDLLRCKLSFFGATEFDPRSDRWVRISLFRHAPFPDELYEIDPEDWTQPASGASIGRPAPAAESALQKRAGDDVNKSGYSANELESLVRKAARGAGLAWGLAEEAGRCAAQLAAFGPDLLKVLLEVLRSHHASTVTCSIVAEASGWRAADHRPLCPITLGSAISDHAAALKGGGLNVSSTVSAPVLLLPFLAAAAERLGAPVVLKTVGLELSIARPSLGSAVSDLQAIASTDGLRLSLELTESRTVSAAPLPPARIGVDAHLWAGFEALAALTYVPESDVSRLKGAGAGLSDND